MASWLNFADSGVWHLQAKKEVLISRLQASQPKGPIDLDEESQGPPGKFSNTMSLRAQVKRSAKRLRRQKLPERNSKAKIGQSSDGRAFSVQLHSSVALHGEDLSENSGPAADACAPKSLADTGSTMETSALEAACEKVSAGENFGVEHVALMDDISASFIEMTRKTVRATKRTKESIGATKRAQESTPGRQRKKACGNTHSDAFKIASLSPQKSDSVAKAAAAFRIPLRGKSTAAMEI